MSNHSTVTPPDERDRLLADARADADEIQQLAEQLQKRLHRNALEEALSRALRGDQ